jgi:hypothetical protein
VISRHCAREPIERKELQEERKQQQTPSKFVYSNQDFVAPTVILGQSHSRRSSLAEGTLVSLLDSAALSLFP